MLETLGLQHLSSDAIYTALAFAVVASIVHGWAVDSVIGDAGFGMIGNSILSLFGGLIGAWTWVVFLHQKPFFGSDVVNVLMFGVAGAMVLLIALAFVRKALAQE